MADTDGQHTESKGRRLEELPGLGPVRLRALAGAGIESLDDLLSKEVPELAAIPGIGLWQARRIREFLRHEGLIPAPELGAADDELSSQGPASQTDGEPRSKKPLAAPASAARHPSVAAMTAEAEELASAISAIRPLADDLNGRVPAGGGGSENGPDGDEEPEVALRVDEPGKLGDPTRLEEEKEPLRSDDAEAALVVKAIVDDDARPARDRWTATIEQRQEQLPDAALALIEAIRQAAVSRALSRQLTRLLILAGEFTNERRRVPEEHRKQAARALELVDRDLQRALVRQTFSPSDQKELARRIRKRRKDLAGLLEQKERPAK